MAAAEEPETKPARRVRDPELVAMDKIAEHMAELDEETRTRVLSWLTSKYTIWKEDKPRW